MLNLTTMAVNQIQGTVEVAGKQHQVTITESQVNCNANMGTPEVPQWLNVSIDRKTRRSNVSMNNYDLIERGTADAQAIKAALEIIVEEIEKI